MPLHERDTVREQIDECVFVGHDLTREVPKYRFPSAESPAGEAYQVVADELMLDGNARQNLATFCQTWAEPELMALMAMSIHKNMIDKDEYPQTAEIEAPLRAHAGRPVECAGVGNAVGASAIGSSEACMLAGMAAKWRWRAKREAEASRPDRPNMVCGPVQVVWHKFAKYWDIEMREVPMSHGHYMMDSGLDAGAGGREHHHGRPHARGDLHRLLRAGGGHGRCPGQAAEPIPAWTSPIHVDGASGAFLAPFCAPRTPSTSGCPG